MSQACQKHRCNTNLEEVGRVVGGADLLLVFLPDWLLALGAVSAVSVRRGIARRDLEAAVPQRRGTAHRAGLAVPIGRLRALGCLVESRPACCGAALAPAGADVQKLPGRAQDRGAARTLRHVRGLLSGAGPVGVESRRARGVARSALQVVPDGARRLLVVPCAAGRAAQLADLDRLLLPAVGGQEQACPASVGAGIARPGVVGRPARALVGLVEEVLGRAVGLHLAAPAALFLFWREGKTHM